MSGRDTALEVEEVGGGGVAEQLEMSSVGNNGQAS